MRTFLDELEQHQAMISQLAAHHTGIAVAGELLAKTLRQGGKILLCGNGGSAADCQHLAAELIVRYERDRPALPALALTTDSSILTAHSNDVGFESVFARQIEALGLPQDCLIALSTSGKSPNIIRAAEAALRKGLSVIALTGGDGGLLAPLATQAIIVPSTVTARIRKPISSSGIGGAVTLKTAWPSAPPDDRLVHQRQTPKPAPVFTLKECSMLATLPDFTQAKIIVIGDVMLDRYWSGQATRISPEAPVPVVRVNHGEDRVGGAANVALNIARLGGQVTLLGVVGDDAEGRELKQLLETEGVTCLFVAEPKLRTICKLRVMAQHQQLIRIDFEDLPLQFGQTLLQAHLQQQLPQHDVLVCLRLWQRHLGRRFHAYPLVQSRWPDRAGRP